MGLAVAKTWPVSPLVGCEFDNIRRIHPLMQRYVEELVETCKGISGIRNVFVFGSAVTGWCSESSDIDVLIESDRDIDCLELKNPQKFDIRFGSRLSRGSDLPSFAREEGVMVYG